jgi:hypothetical protein
MSEASDLASKLENLYALAKQTYQTGRSLVSSVQAQPIHVNQDTINDLTRQLMARASPEQKTTISEITDLAKKFHITPNSPTAGMALGTLGYKAVDGELIVDIPPPGTVVDLTCSSDGKSDHIINFLYHVAEQRLFTEPKLLLQLVIGAIDSHNQELLTMIVHDLKQRINYTSATRDFYYETINQIKKYAEHAGTTADRHIISQL